MQCAACGFIDTSVTPSDAAVALRSYPRRFKSVLVRLDDEDGADVILRPAADGWSALDHAAHLVESLQAAVEALRLASIQDRPMVALAPERRPAGSLPPVDTVLADLAGVAEAAAGAVDRIRGKDWDRPALLGDDDEVTALDLARHAVHEGVHHLRAAEHAVSQA